MQKFLMLLMTLVFATVTTEAMAARKHVRIYKPSPYGDAPPPGYVPGSVPLVAVPPVAVAFDLARRTSCDPRVAVGTGKGDPGFDPNGPKTGNWLVPAIYRSQCGGAKPKWYGW